MNFVLYVRGDLDFHSAFLLQQKLCAWAEQQSIPPRSHWIIDFSGVERVCTSSLFILAELCRFAAQKHCCLRLCNLNLPAGASLQLNRLNARIWRQMPGTSLNLPQKLGVSQRFGRMRRRLIAVERLRGGEAAVSGYAIEETGRRSKPLPHS